MFNCNHLRDGVNGGGNAVNIAQLYGIQALFAQCVVQFPIIAAAVNAPFCSSADNTPALRIAATMTRQCAAKAQASATPTASVFSSDERAIALSIFRRMSFA